MDLRNPPSICIGECYICMNKMYFEDYAPEYDQRMQQTCGDVKHQVCYGCFHKLTTLECPYCRKPLINAPFAYLNGTMFQRTFAEIQLLFRIRMLQIEDSQANNTE